MNNQIHWKRGEFHTFYAQMKIRVGGPQNMDIQSGDAFEYDGSIVKYAGAEFPQPGVRGAIRDGWATLDEEGAVPATFIADRPVAKSQSVNKDLSRIQRHERKTLESSDLDEDVVLEVGDRKAARDPRTGRGHVTKSDNRRKDPNTGRILDVHASDIDEQDAVPISRIKSPTHMKVDVLAQPHVARDIENRDHKQGFGRAAIRKASGPQTIEREGVIIRTNVGSVSSDVHMSDENDEGVEVGRVRRTDKGVYKEGVTVRDTSGNGRSRQEAPPARQAAKRPAPAPAKAAPKKAAPPAKAAPKPAAKAAPPAKAAPAVEGASPKLKKAMRICPEFPSDWNFFGKPEDKLARIKQLKPTPALLDAVHSTDSPAMQRALEKHFPQHFA